MMMMMIRPHRRRIRIVQSYLLGSANMHPPSNSGLFGPTQICPQTALDRFYHSSPIFAALRSIQRIRQVPPMCIVIRNIVTWSPTSPHTKRHLDPLITPHNSIYFTISREKSPQIVPSLGKIRSSIDGTLGLPKSISPSSILIGSSVFVERPVVTNR